MMMTGHISRQHVQVEVTEQLIERVRGGGSCGAGGDVGDDDDGDGDGDDDDDDDDDDE